MVTKASTFTNGIASREGGASGVHARKSAVEACGILLFYEAALPLLRSLRRVPDLANDLQELYVIGYPRVDVTDETLHLIGNRLGVRALRAPRTITEAEYREVYEVTTARSRECEEAAHREGISSATWAFRANDRMRYRLLPIFFAEATIRLILAERNASRLIVPWLAKRFDTVERPEQKVFAASAHECYNLIERIRKEHQIPVVALWRHVDLWERLVIPCSESLYTAVRLSLLVRRTARDRITPFPAGRPITRPERAAVGFIIDGASPWNSLKPLIDVASEDIQPVLFVRDILKTPTGYRTLCAERRPFIPTDSLLPFGKTLDQLARSAVQRWRTARELRGNARHRQADATEHLLQLNADAALNPELDLFVAQLQEGIRQYRLKMVVTANCMDAFLSAATHVSHREGVPHFCIQNAATERVRFTRIADCDVFFTESRFLGDFLRENGALGRVEAVGLPYYDELYHATLDGHRFSDEQFPSLRGKKIIGVTTQTSFVDFSPVLSALTEFVLGREDVGLVIKLHPREAPDAYSWCDKRLRQAGRGGRVQHVALTRFLQSCDILVSSASTTILWSILLGVRPLSWLAPQFRGFSTALASMRPEVTYKSESPSEIVQMVSHTLSNPNETIAWQERRRRFIPLYATGFDGQASRRILDRMYSAVGVRKRADVPPTVGTPW